MATQQQDIPGLFTSLEEHLKQPPPQADGQAIKQPAPVSNTLNEMINEKNALTPEYVHASRLLSEEISRMQHGEYSHLDPNSNQSYKCYISEDHQRKYNLVGRLLGPRGHTLKRIQAETNSRMSILGRGSMRSKPEEEKQRNSGLPGTAHLNEHLHVLVEVTPPNADVKLAAAVAELRKFLIPPPAGEPDTLADKYLSSSGGLAGYSGPPPVGGGGGSRGPPRGDGGGRGRGRGWGSSPRGRGPPRGRDSPRGRILPPPPAKRPSLDRGFPLGGGYSPRGGGGGSRAYNGAAERGGGGGGGGYGGRGDPDYRHSDREGGPPPHPPPPPRGRYGGFDEDDHYDSGPPPVKRGEGGPSGPPGGGERGGDRYGPPERRERGGGGGYEGGERGPDFRSSDPYSGNPSENDSYYSSFADSPHPAARRPPGPGGDWKAARMKREPRHHPYSQGGGAGGGGGGGGGGYY